MPGRVLPSPEAGPPLCPLVDVGRAWAGHGRSGQLCLGRSAGDRAVPWRRGHSGCTRHPGPFTETHLSRDVSIATSPVWGRCRAQAEVGRRAEVASARPSWAPRESRGPCYVTAPCRSAMHLVLGSCLLPSLLFWGPHILLALWAGGIRVCLWPRSASVPHGHPIHPGPGPGVRLSVPSPTARIAASGMERTFMKADSKAGSRRCTSGLVRGAADERQAGSGDERFHPIAASGKSAAGLFLQIKLALFGGHLPRLD